MNSVQHFVEDERKRPNTYEIIKWRNACHKNISIHSFDSQLCRSCSEPSLNQNKPIILCFVKKDQHCFPILNMSITKAVAKGSSLLSNIHEIEFSVHHPEEDTVVYKNMNHYNELILNPGKRLIVLPLVLIHNVYGESSIVEVYSTDTV